MPTPQVIGERIKLARTRQRFTVQSAAKAAHLARGTWAKIEAGESVHDTKRQAALDLLGLDADGHPIEATPSYVSGPGERVEGGGSDDEVLRAIRAMHEDVRALSERVARLEEDGPT